MGNHGAEKWHMRDGAIKDKISTTARPEIVRHEREAAPAVRWSVGGTGLGGGIIS
jgi:hypothetical protein